MLRVKKYWHHLLETDVISFSATRKFKKSRKSMKIANIDREVLHNFWTTWGISMKFSGKMWLTIILKVTHTKKEGFTLSLEDPFFEKPQGGLNRNFIRKNRNSNQLNNEWNTHNREKNIIRKKKKNRSEKKSASYGFIQHFLSLVFETLQCFLSPMFYKLRTCSDNFHFKCLLAISHTPDLMLFAPVLLRISFEVLFSGLHLGALQAGV